MLILQLTIYVTVWWFRTGPLACLILDELRNFMFINPDLLTLSALLKNLKIIETKSSRHVTYIFRKMMKFGNKI